MELLETRFYSLSEIREITGKRIKRDVTHLLDLWGYKYQWTDRQGVTITQCPEALSRFAELMRRHLHINSQIKPYPFGCFLLLLLEDEAFSSMPWEERAWQLADLYGIEVSDRTLRNWASYLFRGEFLMKDKETRTVWYTEPYGSLKIQVQVKDPDEDTTYQNYLQERKDRVEFLRKSGMPFSKAYKETVCYLWEKYHRIYYYCYTLVSNAIQVDYLIEILRVAIQDDIL